MEGGRIETFTPMHYIETRRDDQLLLGTWVRHHLVVENGALKIKLKRVDIVNSDSYFGNIQLFI